MVGAICSRCSNADCFASHTRESVLQGPSLGALTETAVVGEWLEAYRQRGEKPALYYWQSSGEAEVDLIVERGGELYGLEIKATATPVPRHADGSRQMARTGRILRERSRLPHPPADKPAKGRPGRTLASFLVTDVSGSRCLHG